MSKATVTRAHLAEEVAKKMGLSIVESSEMVDMVFDQIIDHFIEDDSLKITAFGSFYKRSKKQRVGRNPKTKKEAVISARKVISFNPSRKLRVRINESMI